MATLISASQMILDREELTAALIIFTGVIFLLACCVGKRLLRSISGGIAFRLDSVHERSNEM
jgi:hypothetical protein